MIKAMNKNLDRLSRRFSKRWILDNASGCHVWSRSKRNGYGAFEDGSGETYAHRVAWKLKNGNIPTGMRVLHRCDNPACVNADHLFLGTQSDNMADMTKKGRHGRQKLTDDQVLQMRAIYRSQSVTQAALSKMFGCSAGQVHNIVSMKSRVIK